MNLSQFRDSLSKNAPSPGLPLLLQALWYDAKGDWNRAHDIADGFTEPEGDWVHAYLHRKEGDQWNANYWYRRAGRSMPNSTLEAEWQFIAEALLHKHYSENP